MFWHGLTQKEVQNISEMTQKIPRANPKSVFAYKLGYTLRRSSMHVAKTFGGGGK